MIRMMSLSKKNDHNRPFTSTFCHLLHNSLLLLIIDNSAKLLPQNSCKGNFTNVAAMLWCHLELSLSDHLHFYYQISLLEKDTSPFIFESTYQHPAGVSCCTTLWVLSQKLFSSAISKALYSTSTWVIITSVISGRLCISF